MSRPFSNESVFRAVAHPVRRRIIELLRRGELHVLDLAQSFRITLPTMSHHLAVLRSAGLISQRRVGQRRVYRYQPQAIHDIARWIKSLE
jgi:DNA-binding transcriptional ArsR family regulator